MENRFGFKDFMVLVLLAVLIVSVWIGMKALDRQWDALDSLSTRLDQQTKDIAQLNRTLSQGVPVLPGGKAMKPYEGGPDAFRRLREVHQKPDFALGGVMVQAFGSAPPKINSLTSHDTYSRMVYMRVLEGLAEWDIEKLEMVPHLAEGWTWAEDKLSIDVKLKRNVTFSDGTPMTSADVVYTWELKKNPEITDGQDRAYYAPIKSVEALGPHEVRYSFVKIHYENFMRAMEVPVLPKHFMSRFSEREIREHPALLMGTGPYRLPDPTKYTPGETIELMRNERYWGVPNPLDKLVFRIIESESTDYVTFRNGDLDMFLPTPEQHVEMVKDQQLLDTTQHHVYTHVRTGYHYIAWNQERGGKTTVFADKRVRQAMTMLLNRQGIIDEILLGFAILSDGPFHPMGPQHNPAVAPWPYDPERAIALLIEAGFTRDAAGRMITPEGKPFEIELAYPSGSDVVQKMALYLKDNLARAGITLKLDPQKWALLLKNMLEKNFEASLSGWSGGSIEGDIEQMFHSRNIAEGDNRNAYRNAELDALIDKAHITLDEEERMNIWHQCHAILHEDQPYTFVMFGKVRLWLDDRYANVQRMPVLGMNFISTWAVPMEWFVLEALQKQGE